MAQSGFASEHVEGLGGYLAPPGLSVIQLLCWDRWLHAGDSVSTSSRKGEAHESFLKMGLSEAGF